MNIQEIASLIRENISGLILENKAITGTSKYELTNLGNLRLTLNKLKPLAFLSPDLRSLLKSWIFNETDANVVQVDFSPYHGLNTSVEKLKTGLEYLLFLKESSEFANAEDVLYIKLPEAKTFEDLSKVSNDLKKGIELPIYNEAINGKVNILSAESGSVWLIVSVGTLAAVKIIAAICWAAAVIRKKNAEAKIFEQHAKTLELKNSALDDIVNAQKTQLSNILTSEAEAIALKHYNHNSPEITERLKLSIGTVADLIDRGTQILPSSNDAENLKAFPNYNQLELIESSIKQLKNA